MKILYLIVLIAAAIFYPLFRGDLSFLLLCTLLAFPVIMLIMLIAESLAIKIRVKDFPDKAVRGEKLNIKIQIRNPLFFPVACCAVTVLYRTGNEKYGKYVVTVPLRARSLEKVSVGITPKHCGAVECVVKKAVLYDLIGLFSKKIKLDIHMTAAVLPREYPCAGTESGAGNTPADSRRVQRLAASSGPAEVSGLREYRDGDRINCIHWKLSSRSEDFVVKEFSEPLDGGTLVVADHSAAKSAELTDRVFDVYYSVMKSLVSEFYDVRALMNDDGLSEKKVNNISELTELLSKQVTEQIGVNAEMSLAARLSSDSERLDPLCGEKYSRIIIITSAEKKTVLSELEQSGVSEGITVLNVGNIGDTEEDKASDVIIYNLYKNGEIEFPDCIAV